VSSSSQLGEIASKTHAFRTAQLESPTPFAVSSSTAAAAGEEDASDPVGAWIAQSDEEAELLERIRRQRAKHAVEEAREDEIAQRTTAYKESIRRSQTKKRSVVAVSTRCAQTADWMSSHPELPFSLVLVSQAHCSSLPSFRCAPITRRKSVTWRTSWTNKIKSTTLSFNSRCVRQFQQAVASILLAFATEWVSGSQAPQALCLLMPLFGLRCLLCRVRMDAQNRADDARRNGGHSIKHNARRSEMQKN